MVSQLIQLKKKNSKTEMIGQKFGRLIVLKEAGKTKWGAILWQCKCDCGSLKIVRGGHLRSGAIRSCGCLQKKRVSKKYGESNFNQTYNDYRSRARKHGRPFKLTKKEFKGFTEDFCHYCGAKPNNISEHPGCNGHYKYNGIDRVDNNKGYVFDNCVSCCKICNKMKGEISKDEFLNHIYIILNKTK